MFNSKVASYNLGLALFRQRCPDLAGVVEYVRDLDPAKLGCTTSELYRRLLKVPERMTRKELRAVLAKEHHSMMETAFATHTEPPHYDLRGVLLFGAAEIARSRICIDFLEQGRIEDFGRLMKVSHDGDRVSRPGPTGAYQRVAAGCPDEYIRRLIADLASEDPDRVLGAQLYMQPGDYACSMPEIDEMVDIACAVPGVAGAQIAGAGLGGCIMMLVRDDAVDAVRRSLIRRYYEPRHLAPAVMPCRATEGAGLVEF
jgi:galactokinase